MMKSSPINLACTEATSVEYSVFLRERNSRKPQNPSSSVCPRANRFVFRPFISSPFSTSHKLKFSLAFHDRMSSRYYTFHSFVFSSCILLLFTCTHISRNVTNIGKRHEWELTNKFPYQAACSLGDVTCGKSNRLFLQTVYRRRTSINSACLIFTSS